MAWSTKVKLPPLKVTQSSSNAATCLRKVPRGKSKPLNVVVDRMKEVFAILVYFHAFRSN